MKKGSKQLSNEDRKLLPSHVEALRNFRKTGMAEEAIAEITGWSKSTVHKYVADVEPKPVQAKNDGEASANSPGLTSTENPSIASIKGDGESKDRDVASRSGKMGIELILDPQIFWQFGGAAMGKGKSVRKYIDDDVLPAVRVYELLKASVPHVEGKVDSLIDNLQSMLRDAIAYRRTLEHYRKRVEVGIRRW